MANRNSEYYEEPRRQQPAPVVHRQKSGVGAAVAMIVAALLFIVGPLAAGPVIPTSSKLVLVGFGVLLLIVGSIVFAISRLYRKASADEAFVRTGSRSGAKAILDGGALIIPMYHNVTPVSLRTMKLTVARAGVDALITGDNLRAEVHAEFYIHVDKNEVDVKAAASTLGSAAINPAEIEALVYEKLVNGLRTAAATKTLEQLNSERKEFANAVQEIVFADLKHNGLTLESVTVSKLDQADKASLRPEDNLFDALGSQKITQITAESKVKRNALEVEAAKKVKAAEVERDQYLYQQDVLREKAEAQKGRDIAIAKAEADQQSATQTAEQQRLAELAKVAKDQAVKTAQVAADQAVQLATVARDKETQMATVARDKEVQVATVAREQAQATAQIEKQKAVELAEREKQVAVAAAEKQRAEAEAQRLAAEAEREKQAQAVKTVEAVQTAERDKQRAVIAKQADAEQTRIEKQVEADVKAYGQVKEAEAERTAAEAKATARLKLAEADQQAKTMEAQGDQAVQMVPVNVAKEGVEVERKKVEVQKDLLEAQSAHQEIVRALQVDLAKIAAQKEVGMKMAESIGVALSKTNMTIYGDPAAVVRMTQMFFQGQGLGEFVKGAETTTPKDVQEAALNGLSNLTSGIGLLAANVMKRLGGPDVDPTIIEKVIAEEAAKQGAGAGA